MSAVERWAAALASWALPEELVAAAPADPWRLDPSQLPADREDERDGAPSRADEIALAALPARGSVLDVGCGPGGSSVHLRGRARAVTGVDQRRDMLDEFEQALSRPTGRLRRHVPKVETREGTWPAVAATVPVHDVVVAHNVLYNVAEDAAGFIGALTDHARRRVVVVVTDRHPRTWLAPYFAQLHGLQRPAEPTAETAVDLVRELTGGVPTVQSWRAERWSAGDLESFVPLVARACCVGEDRHGDVRRALRRVPPPSSRSYTAIAWDGTAV